MENIDFKKPRTETVLITGGAGGIGREFSKLFAANGYRLVVVGWLQEELDDLAAFMDEHYPEAEVLTLQLDLSRLNAAEVVYQWCADRKLHIDVLVNNVGFGLFGDHVDLDIGRLQSMLLLNTVLLTKLVALFGKDMKQRKSGKILNVASLAGFGPMPLFAAYAATKSYVVSFSSALAREMEAYGISVSCLCPGATKTAFFESAKTSSASAGGIARFARRGILTPEEVAIAGYRGLCKKKLLIFPTTRLYLKSLVIRLMPPGFATWYVMRQSKDS